MPKPKLMTFVQLNPNLRLELYKYFNINCHGKLFSL